MSRVCMGVILSLKPGLYQGFPPSVSDVSHLAPTPKDILGKPPPPPSPKNREIASS